MMPSSAASFFSLSSDAAGAGDPPRDPAGRPDIIPWRIDRDDDVWPPPLPEADENIRVDRETEDWPPPPIPQPDEKR